MSKKQDSIISEIWKLLDKLPISEWDSIADRDITDDVSEALNSYSDEQLIDLHQELTESLKQEVERVKAKKEVIYRTLLDVIHGKKSLNAAITKILSLK